MKRVKHKDENDSEELSFSEEEERGKKRHRKSDKEKDKKSRKDKREKRREKKKKRNDDSDEEEEKTRTRKDKRKERRKRKRRDESSSSSEESSDASEDEASDDSSSGSESESDEESAGVKSKQISEQELREYLAKKAQKKSLKLAKKLRSKDLSGYTNDENPFGDSNLTERFVWRKKIEKDVMQGKMDVKHLNLKEEKERLKERMHEIEKVKKRREERMLEKARHEEEMALLARERARAEFQDWEQKEEEFHFEQAKTRAEIRIKEGRAKPIDVLAKNLKVDHMDFDVELNEPYTIFQGLTVLEMEDLRDDIRMHLELDHSSETNQEFWKCLMIVCVHELSEAAKREELDKARVRGKAPPSLADSEVPYALPPTLQASPLHSSVSQEIDKMLEGKGSAELSEMEENIEMNLRKGEAKLVEYWQAVLKRLKIFRAKARLREIHADLLRRHLSLLQGEEEKEEGGKRGEWSEDEEDEGGRMRNAGEERGALGEGDEKADVEESYSPVLLSHEDAMREMEKGGIELERGEREGEREEEREGEKGDGENAGSYSPVLLQSVEGGEDVVDEEADKRDLEEKRAEVLLEQKRKLGKAEAESEGETKQGGERERAPESALTPEERASALRVMGNDSSDIALGMGAEVSVEPQVFWWHDKYRPRKPKYFNRVHTGYEWNKYNQTHYDHDNPPPKTVQGYKFNLFYPDLIDKTKAPTYSIEKDGNNVETCIIRFHAGPPYEDMAFRIVNREWEYSHKKGFKCTFERGILHVYFNFKRHRYRR